MKRLIDWLHGIYVLAASYYLIPALAKLRSEINARFPNRDKTSDGWIGDTAHSTRPSSHNPDYAHGGAVRGIDFDVDDRDPNRDLRLTIINAAKNDPRVWYIISNGIIYSRTHNFEARKYLGENQHFKHVHVSAVEDQRQWTNTSRWLDPERTAWVWNPDVVSDLAPIQIQFQIAQGMRTGARLRYHGVAAIQNALNVKAGANLPVDGYVGQKTLAAWRAWETKNGGTDSKGTPDPTSLRALQIAYRFKGPQAN